MAANPSRLAYLLQQYATKNTRPEEEDELYLLIEASDDETLKTALMPILESSESLAEFDRERWQPMINRVMSHESGAGSVQSTVDSPQSTVNTREGVVRKMQLWKRIAVAASILLVVWLGSYFIYFNKKDKPAEIVKTTVPSDVKAPETNRAMITLADGRTVYLDSVGNGELAKQGNIKLVKLDNGQIAYQTASGEIIKEIRYNTLSNPRGSKVIDMTLADGSRVWLNAGSSVTYPVSFIGKERKVTITGEAYFEVAHDANKPFYVSKGDVQVQVLGTHFNVNAYDDESDIKVTLLEGSVRVTSASSAPSAVKIKPGEQAVFTHNSQLTIHHPDVEQVMAWKNGLFKFNDTNIESIMRQVERWYDVEAIYELNTNELNFSGVVGRKENISQILKVMELTGLVKFKIEGKKVTVMK